MTFLLCKCSLVYYIINIDMVSKRLLKLFLCACLLLPCSAAADAALFSAPDKAFTIDLPSDWKTSSKKGAVLYAKNGKSTFQIDALKKCSDLACLESAIKKDISSTKSKKFKILVNTYTGETIKRTEFSTSDPLLSFNFTGGGSDFTYGYFLADSKAYKVEIKGLPYVEADLILSFISPAPKPVEFAGADTAAEMTDLQMGDISIDEQPLVEEEVSAILNDEDSSLGEAPKNIKETPKLQAKEAKVKINLKSAGWAGGLLVAVMVYVLLLVCLFALRLFFPAKPVRAHSNPRSVYPVRGKRFYGSPDLFFRFYDNQGNNFITTSPRWGGIFTGLGLASALFFFLLKVLFIFLITGNYVKLHPVLINTALSLCSLFSVFGLLIFCAGVLTTFLFASKFYFYSDRGSLAFRCVRQGFSVFKEEYAVANAKNAIIFRISRDRFRLTRRWTVYSGEEIIALIREASLIKALLRKCCGHLCGFLRTEYVIKGRVESSGGVKYEKNIFTKLTCEIDKPEAIDSKILIIACAVISMRDRDKWYPWVN